MCDNTERLRAIVEDPTLTPAQKAHRLAIAADELLPYPALDEETRLALEARVICDMYEARRLMQFRRIAIRHDKTAISFLGFLALGAARFGCRLMSTGPSKAPASHGGRTYFPVSDVIA